MRKPKKDGWFEHGMNCAEYLEHIDERGCVWRFSYYAISDPTGQHGSLTRPATPSGPAGYLAAIWRPATRHAAPNRFVPVVSYEYDNNGCVIALRDATNGVDQLAAYVEQQPVADAR